MAEYPHYLSIRNNILLNISYARVNKTLESILVLHLISD